METAAARGSRAFEFAMLGSSFTAVVLLLLLLLTSTAFAVTSVNQMNCVSCHTDAQNSHLGGTNCLGCHPQNGYNPLSQNHPTRYTNADCEDCHWPQATPPLGHASDSWDTVIIDQPCTNCHPAYAAWAHTDAGLTTAHTTTTTGCEDCHDTSLMTEHQKYPAGSGTKYDCDVCHRSTDPAVKAAISGRNTACAACHGSVSHDSLHIGGLPSASCAGCHDTNISTEHAGDCAGCHESTDSRVQQAISNHTIVCTACHPSYHKGGQSYVGAADPSAGASAYVYLDWWAVEAPTVTANTGTPHGGYTTTSVKCAVCHSVHRAAPAGSATAPVADTLLRFKASDSCGYCHVAAGSTVVDPVYGGVWPVPAEAGHALATPACSECHASVHGANAETIPSLAGLLLKTKVGEELASRAFEGLDYDTSVVERVAAIEASAAAEGFSEVTGYSVADYESAAVYAADGERVRNQAVGVFCGGCHDGSYASAVAGARGGVANGGLLGASLYAGHRTLAAATTNWNATGNISSGARGATGAGFKIADKAANDCYGCHDSYNGFGTGKHAFPHNWGTAGDELLERDPVTGTFENQSMTWLLAAPDSSTEPTRNGGAIGKAGHAGPNGGTLSDGVCLKCHVWSDGGVGETY